MTTTKNNALIDAKWIKIKNICRLVNGDAYKPTDWSESGKPIIRIQNLNDKTKTFNYWAGPLEEKVRVKDGDVLLAWSGTPGTSFGVHRWWRGDAVLNQHIFRVDFTCDDIIPDWFVISTNHQLNVLIDKAHGAVGLRHVQRGEVENLEIPLPPLDEQQRIVAWLNEKLAAVERARSAAEEQFRLTDRLIEAYIRDSLSTQNALVVRLQDCLVEVKQGVGDQWSSYPVIGATRAGLAPAKEKVGKNPGKYKLAMPGTVFYNPMRINIGSIAMLDEDDKPGITSPDYVVLNAKEKVIHPRWFYYWLRSSFGEEFIKTLARGAVRERMLFNRLSSGSILVPSWKEQCWYAQKLKDVRKLQIQLEEQLNTINRLSESLLTQVFTGAF